MDPICGGREGDVILITIEDKAYITASFVRLEEACQAAGRDLGETYRAIALGRLPRPCYVLDGEVAFVPGSYFSTEIDRAAFVERYLAESDRRGITAALADAAEGWEWYLSGLFGVCLCVVTPEAIVSKQALMTRIEELMRASRDDDERWRSELHDAVDELDRLERPFSPSYDRARFGRAVSRETHVNDVRRRLLSGT